MLLPNNFYLCIRRTSAVLLRSGRLYGENDTKSGMVFVYWKRTNANTMCAMKKLNILIGTLILSAGLAGCSSSYYASSGYANDDLYALHDKTAIARKQQAAAEARKAEAEARRAEWEAKIAEAQALAAENGYYDESSSNPYNDILADTYESAYARRLRGFESPTYRMPSSYYNFRYGSSFTYATAYDPAFYNIIISGDEVWVEPKYITSMFGTWGGTPYGGWYFGWNYSPSWWGYPSYAWGGWNWGFGFTWYDPWWGPGWHPYWGPGWGPGWGGGWHGHHHAGHRPRDYYGNPGATLPAEALRGRGTATEVMPAVRAAAATAPTAPATAAATATVRSAAARAAAVTTTGAAVTITAVTAITAVRGAISTAARGMTSTAVRAAAATTTAAVRAAAAASTAAVRGAAAPAAVTAAAARAVAVRAAEDAVMAVGSN